jgi:hypothetical protein
MVEAYPLQWPVGRPRTEPYRRKRAIFKTPRGKAIGGLLAEIKRLGGRSVVISSNLATYERGGQAIPYAGQRVDDPGVAVYFELKGRQRCFALDRYTSIDDNIHAVELTIMALRGVERWGGAEMMDAAFSGFQALPAPDGSPMIGKPPWYAVLGVDLNSTKEEIRRRYLELAKETHPDSGGSVTTFQAIKEAYEEGMRR